MEELEQIHIKIFESDVEYLRSINSNVSEAVRTVVKKARNREYQPMIFQFLQFIILGMLSLGVGGMIVPMNGVAVFLMIVGGGLCIFGIVGLINIIYKRNKELKV